MVTIVLSLTVDPARSKLIIQSLSHTHAPLLESIIYPTFLAMATLAIFVFIAIISPLHYFLRYIVKLFFDLDLFCVCL